MSKEVKKEEKLNPFEQSIKDYLDKRAAEDELFSVTYAKTNKTLKECCNYVMKCAKDGGRQGYADSEVFGWAVHYYDEDDIKNVPTTGGKVIINQQVELTEEEKVKAREKAVQIATTQLVEEVKKDLTVNVELSEKEIAEAKKTAMDKVISETQEKMTKKKSVKKTTEEKPETPTLF